MKEDNIDDFIDNILSEILAYEKDAKRKTAIRLYAHLSILKLMVGPEIFSNLTRFARTLDEVSKLIENESRQTV